MQTTETTYSVYAPSVPGAEPVCQAACETLAGAREYARERFGRRRDLLHQDVVIYREDGRRVAFAGPLR